MKTYYLNLSNIELFYLHNFFQIETYVQGFSSFSEKTLGEVTQELDVLDNKLFSFSNLIALIIRPIDTK